jgi:hypothetical protein
MMHYITVQATVMFFLLVALKSILAYGVAQNGMLLFYHGSSMNSWSLSIYLFQDVNSK